MAKSLGEINKTFAGGAGLNSDPLIEVGEDFAISYLVIATSCTESLENIKNATNPLNPALDIPKLRTQRGKSYLTRKDARELNSGSNTWQVDCFYEEHVDVTWVGLESGPKRYGDYTWGAESIMEVITRDAINGTSIANAVGEPFILEAPISIPVLTYSKILPPLAPDYISKYLNKVNSQTFLASGTFTGFPPRTALMADIQDNPIEISGRLQRRVTYVVKFNLRMTKDEQGQDEILGWRTEIRNRGSKYFLLPYGTDGKERKFRDEYKDVTDGDLELDGTKRGSGKQPLYLKFNKFETANFNALGISIP